MCLAADNCLTKKGAGLPPPIVNREMEIIMIEIKTQKAHILQETLTPCL